MRKVARIADRRTRNSIKTLSMTPRRNLDSQYCTRSMRGSLAAKSNYWSPHRRIRKLVSSRPRQLDDATISSAILGWLSRELSRQFLIGMLHRVSSSHSLYDIPRCRDIIQYYETPRNTQKFLSHIMLQWKNGKMKKKRQKCQIKKFGKELNVQFNFRKFVWYGTNKTTFNRVF